MLAQSARASVFLCDRHFPVLRVMMRRGGEVKMTKNRKVWFVDDLPENLDRFRSNHKSHFDVETFTSTGAVLRRIHNKEYPDALLCDVFFYDSVAEARDVEQKIEKLAAQLKATATEIGANDHTHAVGITLMKNIFEHFGGPSPPFPMYAYTSKGPFLLEQNEWENISKYGAEVLLKNRISPKGSGQKSKAILPFPSVRILVDEMNRTARIILWALLPGLFYLFVGRFLRGAWYPALASLNHA